MEPWVKPNSVIDQQYLYPDGQPTPAFYTKSVPLMYASRFINHIMNSIPIKKSMETEEVTLCTGRFLARLNLPYRQMRESLIVVLSVENFSRRLLR